MSTQEIERKYLVATLPGHLDRHPSVAMEQGYLACEPGGAEVRLRRAGEALTLTVKGPGHLARMEREVTLSAEQFEMLWPATVQRRVAKTRFRLPHDALVLELDVYAGPLEGLVTVDVEFASVPASEAFVPPAWFGREVTTEAALKNRRLAEQGLPSGADWTTEP